MAEPIFSDINFFSGFGTNKATVTDMEAINQNIMLMFGTAPESKWFQPELGSSVYRYLFDPIDEITAKKIKTEIDDTIVDNGEWRVLLSASRVIPNENIQGYFVDITYEVTSMENSTNRLTFNYIRPR